MTEGPVPDLSPPGVGCQDDPGMAGCPLIDEVAERHRQARTAAWMGIFVAILGVLSWSTYGFVVCGAGAIACGLYARRFAPIESMACFVAGAMLAVVLGLRGAGLL